MLYISVYMCMYVCTYAFVYIHAGVVCLKNTLTIACRKSRQLKFAFQ